MHKAHETIWLQVDPDGESYDPEQWGLEDDATWCKDQINANDVKYVRTDIAEAELEAARADSKEAWEKLCEQCIAHDATIQKLAAEQAKNVGLREALEYSIKQVPELATVPGISKAISATSDTSALEAIVKKAGEVMREECITAAGPEDSYQDDWIRAKIDACDAIRTIPAVTLGDLK